MSKLNKYYKLEEQEEIEIKEELSNEEKLRILEFLEAKQERKMLPFLGFFIIIVITMFIVNYHYSHFISDNIFVILIIGIILTLFLGRKMMKISYLRDIITKEKQSLEEEMEVKKNSFEGIITLISKKRMRGHFLERDTYYKEVNKNILYYKDKIISVEKFKK